MKSPDVEVLYQTRMHRIRFVRPLLGLLFTVLLWITAVKYFPFSSYTEKISQNTLFWIKAGVAVLIVSYLFGWIKRLIPLLTSRWTVTSQDVIIESGILWNKRNYHITPEKIFEAVYFQFGIFHRMFNYGTLKIKKSDGIASYETINWIRNPHKGVELINRLQQQNRANNFASHAPFVIQTNSTVSKVDELEKLINLREKGKISAEEYKELKAKII